MQVRVKLRLSKLCCLVGGRLYGNYLISAYLLVKCLYVANAVGQLFLLDAMLGIDYHMYGLRVVQKLFRGKVPNNRLINRKGREEEETANTVPFPGLRL